MNITYFKEQFSDKLSICISVCCILHCIALPLIIIILPTVSSYWINDENVHIVLVLFAVPISIFAMAKSLRKHHSYKCIALALIGLLLLVVAIFMHDIGFIDDHGEQHFDDDNVAEEHGHDEHGGLGEKLEMIFTVLGGLILFFAHYLNIKMIKKI